MAARSFRDRTLLITGAAGGLGRALCRQFAAEGARIAALDIAALPLAALKEDLDSRAARSACAAADLTDESQVQKAVAQLERELGPIHTLVCNAGITHLKNFGHDQSNPIRRVMDVNFFGSVHATAACIDSITEARGMIISISSVAGYAPLVGRTGYCASKHALHGFFDTLRCELRETGVDVMMVCPSYIATDIRKFYEAPGAPASPSQTPEIHADRSAEPAKGRVVGSEASPEQVAERIVKAAKARRRELPIGTVGRFAWWCRRLAPRLYERLMLRSIRDEV